MLHFEYNMFPMGSSAKAWSPAGGTNVRTFSRWRIARGRESLRWW